MTNRTVDRTLALKPGTAAIIRSKAMQRNALNMEIQLLLEVAANENGVGAEEEYTTDDNITSLIVFKKQSPADAAEKKTDDPSESAGPDTSAGAADAGD